VATLVVSDLHLGSRAGGDLARRPELRAPLLAALDGVERVVLLGDVLELRDRPLAEALEESRAFFEDLGEALGDREAVLVPGNHDHHLIAAWMSRRRGEGSPVGLAERVAPADASDAAAALTGWLGRARLELSYPGVWIRPDVYALHGHYLDRHVTVPSFEPLAVRASERIQRREGGPSEGVEAYEAAIAPVCAALYELAQSRTIGRLGGGGHVSQRAYRVLAGDGRGRRPLHHRLFSQYGFPAAVAAINAVGIGPVLADLSGRELRRSGLRAIGQVVEGLGIEAEHVIFGHTHRGGPFGDDEAEEWTAPGGARLVNTGSWIFEPLFAGRTPNASPYWPGGVVHVPDRGAPELRRLLGYKAAADFEPVAD
jgi:hypothetical protein